MNTRILFLGWEFPPNISGGLGVASYDLCMDLAQITDLTIVLPYGKEAHQIEGANIIGLFDPPSADTIIGNSSTTAKTDPIAYLPEDQKVELGNPYDTAELQYLDTIQTTFSYSTVIKEPYVEYQLESKKTLSLYAQRLFDQVIDYTNSLIQLADTLSFDCIHANDWMTFLAGLELKRRYGKPLICHVHSLEFDRTGPENKGWVYQLEQRALSECDHIVAVSQYTAGIIKDHYLIERDEISVVYNATAPVQSFSSAKPFPQSLVLFVGRMVYQKGPDLLVQMAQKVLQTTNEVRFVMVGKGNELRPAIDLAARLGIGDKIHFTGYLEDDKLKVLLSMADLFVMPSRSEPFGLVALEAAQFAIPAILSKHSGVAEVLPDAYKVDPGDIDTWVSIILRLVDDKATAKEIGLGLKQNVSQISWTQSAAELAAIYSSVISS